MKKYAVSIILIGIALLFGEWFRFIGTNWDSNGHLHPDERFLTMVTTGVSWPKTIFGYFDTTTSPMNPHNSGFSFYVYGTYPMHIVRILAESLGKLTYNDVPLLGRRLSTVLDLATICFVYLIGFILSGKRPLVGFMAAMLYALAPLPIQLSHFYTVDPFVTLFSTITLYHLLRGKFGWMLGVIVGLAVGAKISAIMLLGIVAFSYLLRFIKIKGPQRNMARIMLCVDGLVFLVAFGLTLRVVYPYLFNGLTLNARVISNWKELSSFDGPTTSFPPGLQWIGVSPLQPSLDLFVWGLGIPQGIIAFIALIWQTIRSFRRKRNSEGMLILLLWIVLILGYQSIKFAKPMRYFWPIYPAITVVMAMTLADVEKRIKTLRWKVVGATLLAALLLIPPISLLHIYQTTNTRVQASRWIFDHLPKKTVIAWEHWDDPIPFPVDQKDTSVYTQIQTPVFDPDSDKKWQVISDTLSRSDYVVVSSNRGYGAIGRSRIRFPQTSRYYQYLFGGSLGFTIDQQFFSRPTLFLPIPSFCLKVPGFSYGFLSKTAEKCSGKGIQFVDDYADETYTVYDHPIVTIFKNTRHLTQKTLFDMLNAPYPNEKP